MSFPREIEVSAVKEKINSLRTIEVILPHPSDVIDYVENHLDLVDVLYPIAEELSQSFGPEAELSLELYSDPEFDDRYLTFYVRQNEYGDVLDKIDLVQQKFSPELEKKSGYLLITTDFRPPRNGNGF